jgi:hypothetical protein
MHFLFTCYFKFDVRPIVQQGPLVEKIDDFGRIYWQILRAYANHMVEKFDNKDAQKRNFSGQMEFCKKSNVVSNL